MADSMVYIIIDDDGTLGRGGTTQKLVGARVTIHGTTWEQFCEERYDRVMAVTLVEEDAERYTVRSFQIPRSFLVPIIEQEVI